ncbi:MAG: Nif3-like dinuclear metal center hexameric protein [Chitinophagaceae bacterium]|nr:Nif3-like dinuclear metal center hexameric protein [Chitinophagaceae bacterium]
MKISDLTSYLHLIAPPSLQEDYDNAGLLIGDPNRECTGVLCTLDVTEDVITEAVEKKCNCIVAHHPLIFRGLKKLSGGSYVERTVIAALKHGIAVFASHTNLDNVIEGVNGKIADKLGLTQRKVLDPKPSVLQKLYTFVPAGHLDKVRDALFAAGAGNISDYTECSFTHSGTGTFKPGKGSNPYSGTVGERKNEDEIKLEVILPGYRRSAVLQALSDAHPYEEVAYDLISLDNEHQGTGSGIIGEITPVSEKEFLQKLYDTFNGNVIKHTRLTGKTVRRVAVCGGAGSFLISKALRSGADVYVTGDIKYHEFFDADGKMLLCDIGHYESEQFTTDLFVELLREKFPTFAVLKSGVSTNPVHYFTGK